MRRESLVAAVTREGTADLYQLQMFSLVSLADLYRLTEWHCVGLSSSQY